MNGTKRTMLHAVIWRDWAAIQVSSFYQFVAIDCADFHHVGGGSGRSQRRRNGRGKRAEQHRQHDDPDVQCLSFGHGYHAGIIAYATIIRFGMHVA